jgi:hypothetical protein
MTAHEKLNQDSEIASHSNPIKCESDFLLFPEMGIQFDELISLLDHDEPLAEPVTAPS